MDIFILILVGFIAGIIGAMLGIGGGSIIVPILVIFLHYPMHTAVAVGLITIIATSISVAHINVLKGLVNLRLSYLIEVITVLASITGGLVSNSIKDGTLQIIFGIILAIMAIIYIKESIKPNINKITIIEENQFTDIFLDQEDDNNMIKYTPVAISKTLAVSTFAGLASGMLGIGGGVFKVPAMNLVSKIPIKVAIATSNYMIGLTAAAGAIPYLLNGRIDPSASIYMIIGVIFGSKYAVLKFGKVTDKKLRILFALFLIFVSIQMCYKGLSK
ncbi:MAG: sulfite exporter TauE/SafE family protein [Calditerrivibrio sp.]|nr:sulfite exporter TauE/SafE family protein [Calditerrivibrio sp.]